VLEARFEESRLEKERAAILSEMSMVNTMDYRVECQILSALHAENKLALRFPIGKEELIRAWTLEDVKVRADTCCCHCPRCRGDHISTSRLWLVRFLRRLGVGSLYDREGLRQVSGGCHITIHQEPRDPPRHD
jgi:hypothetical protein